jgi:hypothetical protein
VRSIGILVLLLLATGCRSTVAETQAAVEGPTRPAPEDPGDVVEDPVNQDAPPAPAALLFEAPAGWESLTDLAFERAIDGWFPGGVSRRVDETTLQDLRRALGGADVTAVRAAVMLARTRDPRAGEVLLERLEQRAADPASELRRDAADAVAAAAFGSGMTGRKAAARLNALANGKKPHPSLSVRVECARASLALGRDTMIPYLVSVLRTGTSAGQVVSSEEDEDELGFAQVRAAEALAARAGTVSRFLPEGSMKAREEEALRLEALLPPPKPR